MIKVRLFICFSLIINMQIIRGENLTPYKNAVSRKSSAAHHVTNLTAEKLFKEENLILIGTGGQMMNEIEVLCMHFNYEKELDLDRARQLLIKSIHTYIDEINRSKDIRRYLKNYPFNCKNVDICISIYKTDGSRVPKKNFNTIAARNGKLYYYTSDPMGNNFPIITKHEETYEEALAAVGSEAIQVKETTPPS